MSFVRPSTRPATLPSLSRASGASEKSPSSLRPATASGASSAKVEAADIRVPFARVADQLPPDVFLEPMERLGQSLREPHVLVIPARVVTSQLANGAVHVEWAVIESQFPQLASALPTPALRARFVGWQLSLPMDEVVRQLPLELLPRTIAVTPQGIDAFPAPFKPSVREEATSPAPSAPAVRPTPPHAVPASPLAPWPSLTATPTAPPTLRPPKPTPPVAAPPTLRPPAPTPPVASASAPPAPPVPPPLRTPVRAPASPPVRPPAAPAPATMAPPSEAAIAEAETIARKLARCTAFDTSVRAREGRTVAVFTEAGVSAELAERLARRIAPLLAGRACVAVRAAHGSLVATRGRHAILVAAMRPSTPSAWADSVLAHSPGDDVPAEREDAAVLAPAPHARLADATIAFAGGAEVPAAAFTDAARGLSLCVLAAPMPQTAARLARRVWQALLQEPDPALGTVTRVTVRRGPEVTIVRPLGGARAELLVAVGSAERVGLAHRQIERAAAVLEGR